MRDIRPSILEEIARIWNVRDSEVTLNEDGFDWLPGSHMVRLRIFEDERGIYDTRHYGMFVATEYRQSVPVHDPQFVRWVGVMSPVMSPTYSFVYPPGDVVTSDKHFIGVTPNMCLYSSVYFDENLAHLLPSFVAQMSILQPANAEIDCDIDARMFGGALPNYATGSKAPKVNEILGVARDVLAPEGEKPNAWVGSAEFEEFIERDGNSETSIAVGDTDGMLMGTSFGAKAANTRFWTNQRHPMLGNGLLVTTEIPTSAGNDENCRMAALLNNREMKDWTDFAQLGCWHPRTTEEQSVLAHSTFILNALYRRGLVAYFAFWARARVQWARRVLLPGVEDLNINDTV